MKTTTRTLLLGTAAYFGLALVPHATAVDDVSTKTGAVPAALLTLVLAVGTAGVGTWVAYAGGKIRHAEFRNEPPPPGESR